MQHFLLIYDHSKQELRDSREFGKSESEAATMAYQQAEANNGDDPNIEIVLIGADSIATVMRTHGHYFQRTDRLAKYLTPA